MTILSPNYHLIVDGHNLATYANGLEIVDGVEVIPGRRIRPQPGAYVDGAYPALNTPSFFEPKVMRIRLWIAGTDADGNVTHAGGPAAHLQENRETLTRILGGSAISSHQVDWVVPTPTGNRTLRNTGRIWAEIPTTGSTRLVRRLTIAIEFPWPFFQDITTGLQTLGPFTGAQSFTPGGTAPLADATLICTAAGRITHDETNDFVEILDLDGASSITITQRPPKTVLKNGGADAREFYNSNRGWGLRFDAGVLANLTITGTWQIDYFNAEH